MAVFFCLFFSLLCLYILWTFSLSPASSSVRNFQNSIICIFSNFLQDALLGLLASRNEHSLKPLGRNSTTTAGIPIYLKATFQKLTIDDYCDLFGCCGGILFALYFQSDVPHSLAERYFPTGKTSETGCNRHLLKSTCSLWCFATDRMKKVAAKAYSEKGFLSVQKQKSSSKPRLHEQIAPTSARKAVNDCESNRCFKRANCSSESRSWHLARWSTKGNKLNVTATGLRDIVRNECSKWNHSTKQRSIKREEKRFKIKIQCTQCSAIARTRADFGWQPWEGG